MSQYPYRIQRFDADSLGGLPASDYLTVDGTIAADQIIGLGTGGGVGGTQAEYAVSAGTARYALNAGSLGGVAASGYLTVGGTIASSQVLGLSDSLASALGTVATFRLVGAIDADSLDGELPSYYLDLGNSTGTLSGDRLYGIPYERLLDAPTGGSGTVDAGNVYGNLDNASIPVSNVSGSIDADAVGGATASQLRDRSTHTGTQPASSIGDLNLILNTLEVGYALNAGSLGGVPASGYLTVGGTIASSQVPGLDDSILSALGTIATSRLVGAIDADSLDGKLPSYYLALENSTGTLAGDRLYGIPYERLTGAPSGTVAASDVYGSLGNASVPASNITGSVDAASVGGATISQIRDRATHTGTQPASSIGDLNSILDTIRGGTASDALLLGGNPPSFYQPASGTIAGDRLTGNAPNITINASQVANLGTIGGGGTQADYALNAGSLGGNPPSFYLRAVAAGTVADIDAARISGTGTSIILPYANINHSVRPIFAAHNDPDDPNTVDTAAIPFNQSNTFNIITTNIFTVSIDTRGGWNSSNSSYAIPERGVYRVSGLITASAITDQSIFVVFLFRNGARFRLLGRGSGSAATSNLCGFGGSHIDVFNAGDILQLGTFSASPNTTTFAFLGYQLFAVEQLYRMP